MADSIRKFLNRPITFESNRTADSNRISKLRRSLQYIHHHHLLLLSQKLILILPSHGRYGRKLSQPRWLITKPNHYLSIKHNVSTHAHTCTPSFLTSRRFCSYPSPQVRLVPKSKLSSTVVAALGAGQIPFSSNNQVQSTEI